MVFKLFQSFELWKSLGFLLQPSVCGLPSFKEQVLRLRDSRLSGAQPDSFIGPQTTDIGPYNCKVSQIIFTPK